MKAVKIKIEWNLDALTEEQKADAISKLPTCKGFTVEDNFDVLEKIPSILVKRFGYPIKGFTFTEVHVPETLEELLISVAPTGQENKNLFTDAGKLSATGKKCKENLERYIKQRIHMERNGVKPENMPKNLDMIMTGVEKVSGLAWDAHTPDELLAPIYRQIWDHRAFNLKDEFEKDDDEMVANEEE